MKKYLDLRDLPLYTKFWTIINNDSGRCINTDGQSLNTANGYRIAFTEKSEALLTAEILNIERLGTSKHFPKYSVIPTIKD